MLRIVKQRVYITSAQGGYRDLLSWQWDSNTDDPEESMERADRIVGWLREVEHYVARGDRDKGEEALAVLALINVDISNYHFAIEDHGLFTCGGLLALAMKECGASLCEIDLGDIGVCLSITKTTPAD